MAESILPDGKNLIDRKIDLFCQGSAELLTRIHERCGDAADAAAQGRTRKRRKKTKKKSAQE